MLGLPRSNQWILTGALLGALFLATVCVGMTRQDQQNTKAATERPGKLWFMENCADCHGEDAKGDGVVVPALKQRPADLTTLAKRNGGKFPTSYVKKVLTHGVGMPVHGTAEMPTWGRNFTGYFGNELIRYLESIQVK